MQDIRYHVTNTVAVILFSYTLAITVNQFFKFGMNPTDFSSIERKTLTSPAVKSGNYDDYKKTILDETDFFEKAAVSNEAASGDAEEEAVAAGNLGDFTLLGTISGPSSIARALIKKRSEKEAEIFKLRGDVYGYKLVRIDSSKVYLKTGEKVEILDMYAKDEKEQNADNRAKSKSSGSSGDAVKKQQTISRAEIQQKVFNNMDNALKGVRAGPYRVNGKIEGYKLFRVRPSNILYQLGARSGDIVKRVNGHAVDSTEKLLKMWQNIQGEGKIAVDIERGGKVHTFDFSITD